MKGCENMFFKVVSVTKQQKPLPLSCVLSPMTPMGCALYNCIITIILIRTSDNKSYNFTGTLAKVPLNTVDYNV